VYYLLDDFNHHHQHAVLAGAARRYASTHRVSRTEGHTFSYIYNKCKRALAGHTSQKKAAKQWKTEQLALSEVEFEWLRQYWIQGAEHHRLHVCWHAPMRDLAAVWQELEACTIDALRTCHLLAHPQDFPASSVSSKKEKRQLARCRKTVSSFVGKEDALKAMDCLLEALQDRQQRREGWAAREQDPVFDRLPPDCHPTPTPLFTQEAPSPLPADLAQQIKSLQKCRSTVQKLPWRAT